MIEQGCVSVSIKGDRDFTTMLRTIARKRKTTVGQLVRDAVDQHYGTDLAQLSSFFEDSVASKQRPLHSHKTASN